MEYLFKVLIIGEPGTGKSSIVKRYVDNEFRENYLFTIGVDFALKVLDYEGNTVKLQLWDIAGQERFGQMTRVYYKEAVACIIVFDITNKKSFAAVQKWKKDLDAKVRLPGEKLLPCLLLANKCDIPLKDRQVSDAQIDELSKELQFVAWFSTSAKENTNIGVAMDLLVRSIFTDTNPQQLKPQIKKTIDVTKPVEPPRDEPCCI